MCQQVVISKRNSVQETDTRFRHVLYVYVYMYVLHMTPKCIRTIDLGMVPQTVVRVTMGPRLLSGTRPQYRE